MRAVGWPAKVDELAGGIEIARAVIDRRNVAQAAVESVAEIEARIQGTIAVQAHQPLRRGAIVSGEAPGHVDVAARVHGGDDAKNRLIKAGSAVEIALEAAVARASSRVPAGRQQGEAQHGESGSAG